MRVSTAFFQAGFSILNKGGTRCGLNEHSANIAAADDTIERGSVAAFARHLPHSCLQRLNPIKSSGYQKGSGCSYYGRPASSTARPQYPVRYHGRRSGVELTCWRSTPRPLEAESFRAPKS